jgi:hypothetical protein
VSLSEARLRDIAREQGVQLPTWALAEAEQVEPATTFIGQQLDMTLQLLELQRRQADAAVWDAQTRVDAVEKRLAEVGFRLEQAQSEQVTETAAADEARRDVQTARRILDAVSRAIADLQESARA